MSDQPYPKVGCAVGDGLPEQVVDAINDVSGAHPGHRAAHPKGTLMAGTFTPTPNAVDLTHAAQMHILPHH